MTSATPLPPHIERAIETAPHDLDRRGLAALFTEIFGTPYSHRTIEGRPYTWRILNGRALTPVRPAVESEYRRFDAAPQYRVKARKTA